MRLLICNDDGIEAPGLARLVKAAGGLSDDLWVVAPDGKRTAAGASLTIARPLIMRRVKPGWYSCSGTPADCVVSAMAWLFADGQKPDLVLAGVNDGRNVAEDLAYSGTLGIAREATFWGIPAIGFSRVKNPDFSGADDEWLGALIASLWRSREEWAADGHWLSINLPASLPAGIRQPRIGRDKIGRKAEILESDGDRTVITVPRGRAHASEPGDENEAIDAGFVSINRLNWFGETRLDGRFLDGIQPQRQG
ncbi:MULTISPECIES: 5'/3'-nucleotidase SurE [unclassified Mesorhizobium]|uniref:5'/3'-nucleotidase SurE n=1 Tax=unclassified Mesorhizobium TaxID=325217 RepID=UPI00112E99E8|nr:MULTISPECIES: 5'/3'-nucleotidase SurE [unclassified Mesorhizobium]MCA0001518.1 5'/3'-nucleotidase SurE [Mesorhizobium sp. B264B2A]MCA0007625.1 5'/3'-nucleotidase SurE [Mesorhizobium sp. B264B1B]MCA0022302.1 5'/3'-nucleotidase SurE [Mesorhizobium sp. B264B1A]TPJ37604.1 5'/3'-nucleotidase SurE [Mesorhizobium sp. B2-6-6]